MDMKKVLLIATATALLWIAQIGAASACLGGWYEPEVPERLR
jgi:cyclic lactone autoinducer peptide